MIFPGQYYDAETSLHYNYFRYYNPQTGRYITPDPIGLEGGINLFSYVENNPTNWLDLSGLFGEGGPGKKYKGHADFPGGNYFEYNAEDDDPDTNPYTHPERHFRDLTHSEGDIQAAIASCDKVAFERAMHRGQDFFSHYNKKYRWKPFGTWKSLGFGHVFHGHKPDQDDVAWGSAAQWSRNRLKEWNEKCSCRN